MNNEEKDLGIENGIEIFSLEDNVNETPLENIVDSNSSETTSNSNVFAYADSSDLSTTGTPLENQNAENAFAYSEVVTPTMTETPTDNFVQSVEPVQNAFSYTETPVALEVPAQATSVQNTDLKDVKQDSVDETSKYNPPVQTSVVSNYNTQSTGEIKSNFKFMIVFAIIMLAIIIALPYIAGYK